MSEKTILVVGGAGYIGSHVNQALDDRGYKTVIFDNLSNSSLQDTYPGIFVRGDTGNVGDLEEVFSHYSIDAVMHFAAFIDVGESVRDPGKYYQNNVANAINLFQAMVRHDVNTLIFSSTAAIFGNPQADMIPETHPTNPINPYGHGKLMVEQVLRDFDEAHGLHSCCLRYFNAAGGDPEGRIRSRKLIQTNLIPIILGNLANSNPSLVVNGNDYETTDGTCVRDYIHVMDLAQAHILGMEQLLEGAASCAYNLGNGRGHSVLEVVASAERVTGQSIQQTIGPRRPGDPALLLADSTLAKEKLGWEPQYSDLDTMISHAWEAVRPTATSG